MDHGLTRAVRFSAAGTLSPPPQRERGVMLHVGTQDALRIVQQRK